MTSPTRPTPLIGWRLLALFYDLWPMLALWMLIATAFTLGYAAAGHGPRDNIAPFSVLQWLLWLACWIATGVYAVLSWRRGGQTLGMRPWRLRVLGRQGARVTNSALIRRYAVGSLSLLLGGSGFWWAWVDRDRLTWHDRASGTRMVRDDKAGGSPRPESA